MHTAADVHTEPILIPQVYPVGDRNGLYVLSLRMHPALFVATKPEPTNFYQ